MSLGDPAGSVEQPVSSSIVLEWPGLARSRYRVLVREQESGAHVLAAETEEPRLVLPVGDFDLSRRYGWRPQARDKGGRQWQSLLPELRLPLPPPKGAVVTRLALPGDGAPAHRVVIRDETVEGIVAKDAIVGDGYLVDWGELDPSHVHRFKIQRWDEGEWSGQTPYQWLYPPLELVEVAGMIERPARDSVVGASLLVEGWALIRDGSVAGVEVMVNGMTAGRARLGIERRDVAKRYSHPEARGCGFALRLPGRELPPGAEELAVGAMIHAADGRQWELNGVTVRRDRVRRLDAVERELEVWRYMAWLERARPSSGLLVSVVVATRNRAARLERCLGSVVDQDHEGFEVIVVDDGSEDRTPEVVAGFEADPRVRGFRGEHRGVCAARNLGLAHAGGSVVCYLDDDNVMDPLWLMAVARTFDYLPETEVLYGARLIDDEDAGDRKWRIPGGRPRLDFVRFDRGRLERGNIADTNVIAHRRNHPEGRFDEQFSYYGDWDLMLRLTRETRPHELPAIACAYSTRGEDRLSYADRDELRAEHERLIAKHALRGSAANSGWGL